MFIKMKVSGIIMDPYSNVPIVVLKDMEEKITVPIWIGLVEASAIAMELENISIHRPLTHDLIKSILEGTKAELLKIEVTDLKDNTFFALLHLKMDGNVIKIDSRPSDAIAIALRTKSPIFVSEKVIEKSKTIDHVQEGGFTEENRDKWTEILENLNPDDFGKYKM
jgi:uncharacterized protein